MATASAFWKSVEWYHGRSISMVKANDILEQAGDGSFLVRDGKVWRSHHEPMQFKHRNCTLFLLIRCAVTAAWQCLGWLLWAACLTQQKCSNGSGEMVWRRSYD